MYTNIYLSTHHPHKIQFLQFISTNFIQTTHLVILTLTRHPVAQRTILVVLVGHDGMSIDTVEFLQLTVHFFPGAGIFVGRGSWTVFVGGLEVKLDFLELLSSTIVELIETRQSALHRHPSIEPLVDLGSQLSHATTVIVTEGNKPVVHLFPVFLFALSARFLVGFVDGQEPLDLALFLGRDSGSLLLPTEPILQIHHLSARVGNLEISVFLRECYNLRIVAIPEFISKVGL